MASTFTSDKFCLEMKPSFKSSIFGLRKLIETWLFKSNKACALNKRLFGKKNAKSCDYIKVFFLIKVWKFQKEFLWEKRKGRQTDVCHSLILKIKGFRWFSFLWHTNNGFFFLISYEKCQGRNSLVDPGTERQLTLSENGCSLNISWTTWGTRCSHQKKSIQWHQDMITTCPSPPMTFPTCLLTIESRQCPTRSLVLE